MKVNLLIIVIAVFLLPGVLAAETSIFLVDFKIGRVEVKREGSPGWKSIEQGEKLTANSIVRTGPHAHIVLIRNNKQIHVGKNSIVNLNEIETGVRISALETIKHTIRDSFISAKRVRRTTVSAVRGEKISSAAGIKWQDDLEPEKEKIVSQVYRKALLSYEKGNFADAVTILSKDIPGLKGKELARCRYLLMLSYFQTGRFRDSLVLSEILLTSTDNKIFEKTDAYFIGTMSADISMHYDRGIALMNKFIRWHPHSPHIPDAYLILAELHRKNGEFDEQNKYIRILNDKFPESRAAAAAKKMSDSK